MRRLLLVVGVLLPLMGEACYNDRDTLGYELYNKPDVQRALTGRFDRYPALYYTMRVDRLRAKGKLRPDEYDDMAVALGRLGRNDEALAALADKAKLPGLTTQDRYRLFANRGTIEAHRWIHNGGKVSEMGQLKAAERDIAEALVLNPHAHFGREGTQLEVIRWLIYVDSPANVGKDMISLATWLEQKLAKTEKYDIGMTLSGLIMLGGAWESPDVALAIAHYSAFHHSQQSANLAVERYKELISLGRKPMDATSAEMDLEETEMMAKNASLHGEPSTLTRFHDLRKEAEAWHDAKTRYMLTRLALGRHPDTDRSFWSDWKEPAMPVLPTKIPSKIDWGDLGPKAAVLTALIGLVIGGLIFRDRIRRRFGA